LAGEPRDLFPGHAERDPRRTGPRDKTARRPESWRPTTWGLHLGAHFEARPVVGRSAAAGHGRLGLYFFARSRMGWNIRGHRMATTSPPDRPLRNIPLPATNEPGHGTADSTRGKKSAL
jgi:hypothetical protein